MDSERSSRRLSSTSRGFNFSTLAIWRDKRKWSEGNGREGCTTAWEEGLLNNLSSRCQSSVVCMPKHSCLHRFMRICHSNSGVNNCTWEKPGCGWPCSATTTNHSVLWYQCTTCTNSTSVRKFLGYVVAPGLFFLCMTWCKPLEQILVSPRKAWKTARNRFECFYLISLWIL